MSARSTASRSSFFARRAHPHDHRPATMKVDTDILSIHRGLLLFVRGWLCEAPSLDRLGSSRGAQAPLLHRISSVAATVLLRHGGQRSAPWHSPSNPTLRIDSESG